MKNIFTGIALLLPGLWLAGMVYFNHIGLPLLGLGGLIHVLPVMALFALVFELVAEPQPHPLPFRSGSR